ncbi:MAG: peptidoglycan-binding domain-containing protein [Pseudorhodobacter sp.]
MSDLIHGPMYRTLPIILSLGLGACQTTPLPPGAAQNLYIELIPKRGDTPPTSPPDACWATDTVPAVIETVTQQIRAEPERRAPDGRLIQPAVFRTETRQRIVSDRREVWFQTPCADEQSVEFIASLQRALKARGFYLAPVTGALDSATAEAIRRYQGPLGLDSPVLALTTARALGISASDLGR